MMSIDDARKTIDDVLASLQLNRQSHVVLQQALQTLVMAAKDKKEEKENGGTE